MNNSKTAEYALIYCSDCNRGYVYDYNDLKWDNNGPDDAPDYYVYCLRCGQEIGTTEELQPLINQLEEYEPDPDNYQDYNGESV